MNERTLSLEAAFSYISLKKKEKGCMEVEKK